MNISSDVLPSIKYNTGTSPTLSIGARHRRSIPDKFTIRPKSQYERKLLNAAALLHTSSGIVISQADESFSIGGVNVLNERFSALKTTNTTTSMKNSQTIDLSPFSNSKHAYQLNQNSAKGNAGANTQSHNMNTSDKLSIKGSSPRSVAKENTKASTLNMKNISKTDRSNIGVKLQRNSSKRRHYLNANSHGKPEFTTSNNKAVKIYLSQKQSADISAGMGNERSDSTQPSAPPCTPSLEMLKKFEYVPSLSDNLAKQQIKSKLKIMKKVENEKERVKQIDKLKNDMREAKEREQDLRKQQRRAIYALNSIMTKAENDQFERFKSQQGLRPKEYPSINVKRK
ncbi:uncharacterized protein DDB_G0288805-like [Watersipora subatra]|uniref:uncharacterized protein DDB_G0288805-like n=1 Tax=Watersipora subatra TaxID=2589382 RepID=UPI00355BBE23